MLDKGLMEDGKKCITKREADKATVVPVEESKWDLSLNSPNTFPGHSNFHFGEHSHLSKFVVYNCVIPNTEFFPLPWSYVVISFFQKLCLDCLIDFLLNVKGNEHAFRATFV